MKFTGHNLEMVKQSIELALAEIHNQIATCPDVNRYAQELEDLEAEKARFQRLLDRVTHNLTKEQS